MKKQYIHLLLLLAVSFIAHAEHRNSFSIFDDMRQMFDEFEQRMPFRSLHTIHTTPNNIDISEGDQLSIAVALPLQENDFNQIESSVNVQDKEVLIKTPNGTITVKLEQNSQGINFVTVGFMNKSRKETKDAHEYSSQSSSVSSRESKNLQGTPLFNTKEDIQVTYKKDGQKLYITIPMQAPEKQIEEQNPNHERIQILIK